MSDTENKRFEVVLDRDLLPSILDHETGNEALFLTTSVATSVARDLEAGTETADAFMWRPAEKAVTR